MLTTVNICNFTYFSTVEPILKSNLSNERKIAYTYKVLFTVI